MRSGERFPIRETNMTTPEGPKLIIGDDWKNPGAGSNPAPAAKSAPSDAAPKLVVDSDWKSQAQAEKEKLAEAEKKAATGKKPGPGGRELPEADFKTLVGTMVTQAGMYLGWFPDQQGRAMVSLEYARFHIDLLGVLAEKVKGNVTAEEMDELTGALAELRTTFVQVAQAVAEAQAERAKGGAPGLNFGVPGPKGPMPGM